MASTRAKSSELDLKFCFAVEYFVKLRAVFDYHQTSATRKRPSKALSRVQQLLRQCRPLTGIEGVVLDPTRLAYLVRAQERLWILPSGYQVGLLSVNPSPQPRIQHSTIK